MIFPSVGEGSIEKKIDIKRSYSWWGGEIADERRMFQKSKTKHWSATVVTSMALWIRGGGRKDRKKEKGIKSRRWGALEKREKSFEKFTYSRVEKNLNRVGSDSCKPWLQPLTQIKTNPRLDLGLVRSPVVTNKALTPICNDRPTCSIDCWTHCNYLAQ